MIWRWQLFNDDGDKYSYRYVFYFCTESIVKVFQNAGDTVKNIPSWFYAGRKSLKTSEHKATAAHSLPLIPFEFLESSHYPERRRNFS